jgi:hypothetical protein
MERRVASASFARKSKRKTRARRKAERLMVRRSALHSPRFLAGDKERPRESGAGLRRTRRR